MSFRRIAITTGDADGIGLEVSAKALFKLGPISGVQFVLFRHKSAKKSDLALLEKKFERRVFTSLIEALSSPLPPKKNIILDICSNESPAYWIIASAVACREKLIDGMVTAPISKTLIRKSGINAIGHTEILKSVANVKDLRMAFLGREFNVVLATDHIALSGVAKKLTAEQLFKTLQLTKDLQKSMGFKKPLALLGLNPHAGELGLIGSEEKQLFSRVIKRAKKYGIKIEGPLSPDAAFMKKNWQKYSFFIACYHDQGLIPFKMVHGQDSGVHLSLGLPFVRTSVDHGTAKDIFGKNKANPSSMIEAIEMCLQLTKNRGSYV